MPERPEPADQLYDRLMQMQAQAFDARRYELAYHILAAALHAAEELNSPELLSSLEALAVSRQAEIDRTDPQHKISSRAAGSRGNFALFTALASTAAAVRGRIAAERAVERLRESSDKAHR